MPQRSRTFGLGLVLIAGAALAVRLVFTLVVAPDVRPLPDPTDAGAYHLLANDLADGRGYIRPYDLALVRTVRPTAEYPPLFPALLSLVSRAGGDTVGAQRLAMCFVGAGTVVLIGLLGRRVAGAGVGLVAAGLAAGYPMLFQSDSVLMPETLYAFLVAATLLLAYRATDQPSLARFGALGLAIGAAILTRAEAAFLVVLLVAPLAVRLRGVPGRRRVAFGLTAVGAALVLVLPWTVRNYARFDELVPVSTNVGSAIDGANCPEMYKGPFKGLWRFSPDCFEGFLQPELAATNEAAAADAHRADGLRYARHHAGEVPGVMAVRWLRTFGFYDTARQVRFEALEWRKARWQTLGMRTYWALLPFAAVGTVVLVRRRRRLWPLASTVVLVSLTTALTYGNQRFRIAAEPALLVVAATGITVLVRPFGTLFGARSASSASSGAAAASGTGPT
jgi:4-amino-4-deoxy-L-arabinose transferase-like glycosyltransferase